MTTISDPKAMTPDDPRWLSWFMQQRRFDRLSRKAQTGASLITDFAAGIYEMGYPGQRRGSYELSDIVKVSRSTGGGIINQLGQFEWVSDGVARLTYDPVTLQPLGLLVEEQRTNSLTRSESFGSAPWTADNATVGIRAGAITPLFETAGSNFHRIGRAGVPITSGQSVTLSVRVKKLGRRYIYIREALVDGTALVNTGFDFDTASVNFTPAGRAVAVAPAQDGSFIISITVTSTATNTLAGVYIGSSDVPVVSSTIPVFLGDVLQGVGLGDVQLEVGASASSYIPTEASQVTRAADVCSVNTLPPWYNPLEGTLAVQFVRSGANNSASAQLWDGTVNNRIGILSLSGSDVARITTAGSTQLDIAAAGPSGGKLALSYRGNDCAFSKNGSASVLDNAVAIPMVSSLAIGATTGSFLNGTISSIQYYPRVIDVQQASA